jgi:hypothetical protein
VKCFNCVIDQEPGFYVVQSPLLLLSVLASVRSTVRVWKDIVMSDARSIIGSAFLCGLVKKEFEGIFLQFLFWVRECDVLTQRRDTELCRVSRCIAIPVSLVVAGSCSYSQLTPLPRL